MTVSSEGIKTPTPTATAAEQHVDRQLAGVGRSVGLEPLGLGRCQLAFGDQYVEVERDLHAGFSIRADTSIACAHGNTASYTSALADGA
jgi:hypothetical protein